MDTPQPYADEDAPLYPPTVLPPKEPLPLHKFLFRFLDNPIASVPLGAYEQPITMMQASPKVKVAWISGPDAVEDVLIKNAAHFDKSSMEKRVFKHAVGESVLTADAAHWRWQRMTLAPPFRHGEILTYVPTMAEAALETVESWRGSPGVREIDDDMVAATFQIIARTMLAGGAPAETDLLIKETNAYLGVVTWAMAFDIFRLPTWVPHPGSWRMHRSGQRLRKAVAAIIERRRAHPQDGDGDLIDRLMGARNPETDAPMDDEALINNLLTLLEAGHETTARALTFTLYLLARSLVWQHKVRAEVMSVAGDGPITADHVPQLQITKQVIEESMRLYPPAPVVARRANRDVTIAGIDFTPRDQIVIPIFAIHRHRQLWHEPDLFFPGRFAPERRARWPRTQFMPFGAGPRICLGMSFAMVEAQVLLATFVRAAQFDWDGRHEPEPISRVTLRPKGGMPLKVTPL